MAFCKFPFHFGTPVTPFPWGGFIGDFSIIIPFTFQGEELMRVKKATVSAVIFVVGTPLIVDPLLKSANSPYQGSTQQKNCFF